MGPRSTIEGKTQGRATLIARNAANGSSISGTAGTDGLFTLELAISTGTNEITITGTDPAGNVKELVLTVRRGSGNLTAVARRLRLQILDRQAAAGPDADRGGLRP